MTVSAGTCINVVYCNAILCLCCVVCRLVRQLMSCIDEVSSSLYALYLLGLWDVFQQLLITVWLLTSRSENMPILLEKCWQSPLLTTVSESCPPTATFWQLFLTFHRCKKTYQVKTQCKGDISHAFETAKITVFDPVVCKTPDAPLQNELLYWTFLANVNSSSCSLYVIGVCLSVVCLSVCLSVVCLSVCNVRAPYSGDWNFPQYFYTIWYVGHLLTSR